MSYALFNNQVSVEDWKPCRQNVDKRILTNGNKLYNITFPQKFPTPLATLDSKLTVCWTSCFNTFGFRLCATHLDNYNTKRFRKKTTLYCDKHNVQCEDGDRMKFSPHISGHFRPTCYKFLAGGEFQYESCQSCSKCKSKYYSMYWETGFDTCPYADVGRVDAGVADTLFHRRLKGIYFAIP